MTPDLERGIFLILVTSFLGITGWLIAALIKAKDDKTNGSFKAIKELAERMDNNSLKVENTFEKMARTLDILNTTMTTIQLTMAREYVTKEDLRMHCIERRKNCRNSDNV